MPQQYGHRRAPQEAKQSGNASDSNANYVALTSGGKDAQSRLNAVWEWLVANSAHWISGRHVSVGVMTDCLLKAVELRARLGEVASDDDSVEGLVEKLSRGTIRDEV